MSNDQQLMTINLAKGFFNAIQGHQVLKANFNDLLYPCGRYKFDVKIHESKLPDIAEAYNTCLKAGMNQEEIIDALLRIFFPLRFFRVGDYEKMAFVLGFIGMRGSGKTCSAIMVAACDFLFRGLPVWSNVPITIRVCYRDAEKIFTSNDVEELNLLDLNEDYGGGAVLFDEVNMEAAESTRFSSGANLQFAYAMQQIRKRQLSLIWTCQGWSWLDGRLRWQTDFCIACRDAGIEKKSRSNGGLGDSTVWRVHDLSGTSGKFDYDYEIKHHYLTEYLIWTGKIWLRPWWQAYNTALLKGQRNYIAEYKRKTIEKIKAEANRLPGPVGDLPQHTNTLESAVDNVIANSGDIIYCADFWQYLNTEDKAIQTRVGQLFAARGYERKGNSHSGYFWKKKEV